MDEEYIQIQVMLWREAEDWTLSWQKQYHVKFLMSQKLGIDLKGHCGPSMERRSVTN